MLFRPFQSQSDEAVDEGGHRDALVLHQLGIHTDGGKAGEGVDLIDEDAAGVLLYEEVAAGQTLAAQCGVGHGGVGLHLVQLLFGQLCRDDHLTDAVLVLVVVGVEFRACQNFARAGGDGGVRADDGALHLVAVHEGLKDHLAVVCQSQTDGLLQLSAVVGLGDAHAGTGVGGFDEDGPAQLGDDAVTDALGVALDLPAGGGEPLGVGDAGSVEHSVGHCLVHADGAGQNAAADVGDAGQLQQALHGAVLAQGILPGSSSQLPSAIWAEVASV